MMSREWLPVVGYEKLYEVSNDGLVKSVDRYVRSNKRSKDYLRKGKQLKPQVNDNGKSNLYPDYCTVPFNKPSVFHWCLLHDKEYEKKRENFVQLCHSCHGRYDKHSYPISL